MEEYKNRILAILEASPQSLTIKNFCLNYMCTINKSVVITTVRHLEVSKIHTRSYNPECKYFNIFRGLIHQNLL